MVGVGSTTCQRVLGMATFSHSGWHTQVSLHVAEDVRWPARFLGPDTTPSWPALPRRTPRACGVRNVGRTRRAASTKLTKHMIRPRGVCSTLDCRLRGRDPVQQKMPGSNSITYRRSRRRPRGILRRPPVDGIGKHSGAMYDRGPRWAGGLSDKHHHASPSS
ncbi:uncharacterized protein B0I36DRAFT_12992 [Microdochium trichocladiopsis]|uniref:Uncharacterized protein n=1 Tax=Microdochium trichocladiopsis TaxID=1682393 RepID=A0A9P8YIL4_9PEZI|nr:uncharacterized protein B0I36DRAFT_12992 [Microdochium trichocladiopsis]KAH7040608.1 hypothetical protein B0I36DRAFT_12992 [Microdochium trichocladiopsis]